jgi:hypothetical protein
MVEELECTKEKARDRSPVLFETGCGQEQAAGALYSALSVFAQAVPPAL